MPLQVLSALPCGLWRLLLDLREQFPHRLPLSLIDDSRPDLQDDVRQTLTVAMADLPVAVQDAMLGIKERGRRRIFVPPALGWVSEGVQLRPATFAGQRQLANHGRQVLVFEVDLVKIK